MEGKPGHWLPERKPANEVELEQLAQQDLKPCQVCRSAVGCSGHLTSPSNGFCNSTPSWTKSLTFRVTTVSRCTIAVAAIMASSLIVSDLPCMSRAHSRKTRASIGNTPNEGRERLPLWHASQPRRNSTDRTDRVTAATRQGVPCRAELSLVRMDRLGGPR